MDKKKSLITTKAVPTPSIHKMAGFSEGGLRSDELYTYLELDPSNYLRWCKANILDNSYACGEFEEISHSSSTTNGKLGEKRQSSGFRGNQKKVYLLSLKFSKKLSMETGAPHKKNEAQEYFIACESRAKTLIGSLPIEATRKAIALANEGKQFGHLTLGMLRTMPVYEACHQMRQVLAETSGKNRERSLRLIRDQVKGYWENPPVKMQMMDGFIMQDFWKSVEHELANFLARSRGQRGSRKIQGPRKYTGKSNIQNVSLEDLS